jgi:hypothetical protein
MIDSCPGTVFYLSNALNALLKRSEIIKHFDYVDFLLQLPDNRTHDPWSAPGSELLLTKVEPATLARAIPRSTFESKVQDRREQGLPINQAFIDKYLEGQEQLHL